VTNIVRVVKLDAKKAAEIARKVLKLDKPHMFVIQTFRGKPVLKAIPVPQTQSLAKYVQEHYEECPWAHLKGEEFHKFIREHGIHPGAACVRWLAERYRREVGVKGKSKKKKTKTQMLIEALAAAEAEKPQEATPQQPPQIPTTPQQQPQAQETAPQQSQPQRQRRPEELLLEEAPPLEEVLEKLLRLR
jgi:hypothetical protein